MQGEVNPFAPPRSSDNGGGSLTPGQRLLPEAARRELAASAPWALWTARFAFASMALGVLSTAVGLGRARNAVEVGGALVSLIGLPIAVILALVFRRYALKAAAVARGEPRGVEAVIDAQRSLMKVVGVLTLIGIGLSFLLVVLGVLAGQAARR
jgi:hypothetical protein